MCGDGEILVGGDERRENGLIPLVQLRCYYDKMAPPASPLDPPSSAIKHRLVNPRMAHESAIIHATPIPKRSRSAQIN